MLSIERWYRQYTFQKLHNRLLELDTKSRTEFRHLPYTSSGLLRMSDTDYLLLRYMFRR